MIENISIWGERLIKGYEETTTGDDNYVILTVVTVSQGKTIHIKYVQLCVNYTSVEKKNPKQQQQQKPQSKWFK